MENSVAYERLHVYKEALELVCLNKGSIGTALIEQIDDVYVSIVKSNRINWTCSACITERIWDAYRLLLMLEKK